MIAIEFDRPGPSSVLHRAQRPIPAVSDDGVLVRVRAAGVSPIDLALRAGTSPLAATLQLPHVTGIDAAGVVVGIGRHVSGVELGDEVFGIVDLTKLGGTTAEFAILTAWAIRPTAFPWEQAAAAGTSVETATRALDLLGVDSQTTILIEGAAGGVGAVAAQLAAARGCRVIGTARAETIEVVAALEGVVAVRAGEFLEHDLGILGIDHVDRALDASGAGVLAQLVTLTGSSDSVVTIADFAAAEHGVRLTQGALMGEADGQHGLAVAAELAIGKKFRVPLRGTFPYSQAAEAHGVAGLRPRWGKVVLVNEAF